MTEIEDRPFLGTASHLALFVSWWEDEGPEPALCGRECPYVSEVRVELARRDNTGECYCIGTWPVTSDNTLPAEVEDFLRAAQASIGCGVIYVEEP